MNENIAKGILWKAQDLSKSPHKNWCSVVKIINKIKSYLDGRIKLNPKQIAYQIDKLTYYTIGIPVSIPLTSNTTFSRARKCDVKNGNKFYTEVSELSYINKESGKPIHQERLSPGGKALFYASFETHYETINAVLSEVRATTGEVFNILVSGTKAADSEDSLDSFLHIIPIGVLDYYRKGVKTPYNLHDSYRKIYKLLSENTSPKAIRSIHLCVLRWL